MSAAAVQGGRKLMADAVAAPAGGADVLVMLPAQAGAPEPRELAQRRKGAVDVPVPPPAPARPPAGAAGPDAVPAVVGLVFILLMVAAVVLLVVVPALSLLGTMLCCWAPSESGGRLLAVLSLVVDGISLALPVAGFFLVGLTAALRGPVSDADFLGGYLLVLSGPPFGLVAFVIFMFFVRQVAYHMNEESTGDEAVAVLVMAIVLPVIGFLGWLGLSFLVALAASHDFLSGLAMSCMATVVLGALAMTWVFFFFKLLLRVLNLLGTLRQVLRSQYNV
jgi:hypothetical protein